MKIKNTQITISKGDITELEVEAIVNAANTKLVMDKGLAGIIKKKGGLIIEKEAVQQGPIDVAQAVRTSAGKLKAKYVIHAATMDMDFTTDENKIRYSCANALKCANQLKVTSLAFPALGCGVGGFPKVAAAKIMTQEILKFLREKTSLKEIIFCLFDDETYGVFKEAIPGYIHHLQDDFYGGPYVTVDAIIEINGGVVFIERSNPPFGLALPGGFVDFGESLEESVVRETKEETNLNFVQFRQFHTYSHPRRDPRFHTISTVFIGKGKGRPKFGDDAKGLKIVKYDDLLNLEYAFDHKEIIKEYLEKKGFSDQHD